LFFYFILFYFIYFGFILKINQNSLLFLFFLLLFIFLIFHIIFHRQKAVVLPTFNQML
jgi:hypothetical protein